MTISSIEKVSCIAFCTFIGITGTILTFWNAELTGSLKLMKRRWTGTNTSVIMKEKAINTGDTETDRNRAG